MVAPDKHVRSVVSDAFETAGWKVGKAVDCESAIRVLANDSVDLIVVPVDTKDRSAVSPLATFRAAGVHAPLLIAEPPPPGASGVSVMEQAYALLAREPAPPLMQRTLARLAELHGVSSAVGGPPVSVLGVAIRDERRGVMLRCLEANTVRVDFVPWSPDLVGALRHHGPDVVVVDGAGAPSPCYESLESLRELGCFVVFISPKPTLTELVRLIQLDVSAVLEHPLDARRFQEALRSIVEGAKRRKALTTVAGGARF